MLAIDSRVGSGELAPLFKDFGISPTVTHLDSGDAAFLGNGPKGVVAVVIERKRIDDLIQSMQSKRLSGFQLPNMAERFDYGYLMVEGIWRPSKDGCVEVRVGKWWKQQGIHYRAVDSYLSTLELQAGMIYRRTNSKEETVFTIVDLFRWWSKPWNEHKAHTQVYAPVGDRRISLIPRSVGLVEKVAYQLPSIDSKARYVAQHFGSVRAMVEAGVEEWAAVEWRDKNGKKRKLGAVTAERIREALDGGSTR